MLFQKYFQMPNQHFRIYFSCFFPEITTQLYDKYILIGTRNEQRV